VENALQGLALVQKVDVRLKTGSVILIYDVGKARSREILALVKEVLSSRGQSVAAREPKRRATKLFGLMLNFIGLTVFMGYLLTRRLLGKPPLSQAPLGLTGVVTVIGALPLLNRALNDVRQGKGLGLFPFLAGACGLAIAFGQALTAFEIIWVLSLGMYLEEYVTERAKRAIREVFEVIPRQAEILLDGVEVLRPVSQLQRGDTVIGRIGKKIPVDGSVLEGQGLVDESHITGRAEPELRARGDHVYAGTRVAQGVLYIRAEKVGADTYLSGMASQVEQSLAVRGEAEKRADILARRLTRMGVAATLGTLVITRSLLRAISVMLVLACPCATVLAASTAIAAAIANAARRHILIKGGLSLENVSAAQTILFDKTGTITSGVPAVMEIVTLNSKIRKESVLAYAATAEARSEHPLARTLLEAAREKGIHPQKTKAAVEVIGRGVRAEAGSRTILVGNRSFMEEEGVGVSGLERRAKPHVSAGRTLIFVATEGRPQGMIVLAGAIRPGARNVLQQLRMSGISRLVLVSGDTEAASQAISRDLGFDEWRAPLLPEDKAQLVASLEAGGTKVLMVGDGVNDALALSCATVGVAMGAGGSEVAAEAADITLAGSDLNDLVLLRLLSRKTLATIEQNFWLANATNILGILAGFGGWLPPSAAGLVHVAHTLGIMVNSSRLLTWIPDEGAPAPISPSAHAS
jgi:cation-transporting P-type ATPase C